MGVTGSYSPSLTVCQLDDCFGTLGMREPVLGRRPQRTEKDKDALSPPPSPIIQEGVAW